MPRAALLALAALISTFTGPTGVQAAAWCAWYDPYTYNCGFYTFEQCQYTVLGSGGWCARNVFEPVSPPGRAAPARKNRKVSRPD